MFNATHVARMATLKQSVKVNPFSIVRPGQTTMLLSIIRMMLRTMNEANDDDDIWNSKMSCLH